MPGRGELQRETKQPRRRFIRFGGREGDSSLSEEHAARIHRQERTMARRLILASASPRRRELLALLRLPFEVYASHVDESQAESVDSEVIDQAPERLAERLA